MLFDLVGNCDRVLDVGCGFGRYARQADRVRRYIGIDCNADRIEYCRQTFQHKRFRFKHIDKHNERYNPSGSDRVRLALSGQWDLIIASSLFTHMAWGDVLQYWSAFCRVLAPRGAIWVTWFRSPPNRLSGDIDRMVFSESAIRDLMAPFTIEYQNGGTTTDWHDQWQVLLRND